MIISLGYRILKGIRNSDTITIVKDRNDQSTRNRDAGYPRAGRKVADAIARKKIEEIVDVWIERCDGSQCL